MREFNLSHATSAFSTYVGSLNSLWGLYIAATFAAAGFGASMKEQFTTQTALLLTIAFLFFAGAHLRGLLANLKIQKIIADEVHSRLRNAPGDITDYPASVAAVLSIALSPTATLAVHLTIDACVVAIIWASAI